MFNQLINKSTITREYLAHVLKREMGFKVSEASKLLDTIIDTIIEELRKDKEVQIRLFGNFSAKHKSERIGRNPKTMVEAKIPARKIAKFKVAPTLKKRINDNINMIK